MHLLVQQLLLLIILFWLNLQNQMLFVYSRLKHRNYVKDKNMFFFRVHVYLVCVHGFVLESFLWVLNLGVTLSVSIKYSRQSSPASCF